MALIECFDVGGTTIRHALIQDEKIIYKRVIPSVRNNVDALVSSLHDLSIVGHSRTGGKSIDCTVMGLPGPVEKDWLLNSAPLGFTKPLSLQFLKEKFATPVHLANDLNLAVQAEFNHGAGKINDSFYLLTLSTGIGAGLVWKKRLVDGLAGEFGHCILDNHSDAPSCLLGHRGCWASFSSGAGIARAGEILLKKPVSAEEVFSLANQKNASAQSIIARARAANAHGIGTMLNAFAVDQIILMGGVGLHHFDTIIPSKEEIAPFTLHPIPPIVPAALGDDIGLWGAYYAGVSFIQK